MYKLHPNLSDSIVSFFHLDIELCFLNSCSYSIAWNNFEKFPKAQSVQFSHSVVSDSLRPLESWVIFSATLDILSIFGMLYVWLLLLQCIFLLTILFIFICSYLKNYVLTIHLFLTQRDFFLTFFEHIRDLFVFFLWVPFWRPDTHISWVLTLCTSREYCGKFSLY